MKIYSNKYFMQLKKEDKVNNQRYKKGYFIKYISIFLAFLGLLIPASYLLGVSFYEGKLNAYGIDLQSFPLDTADVYINSYYAVSYYIIDFITWLVSNIWYLIIPIFILLVVSMIMEQLNNRGFFRKKSFIYKYSVKYTWVDKVFFVATLFIILLAITLLLGFLWIFMPQGFYNKGGVSQSNKIRALHSDGCKYREDDWSICTQILDEDNVKINEGILIAQTDDKIALYKINGSFIITLKKNQTLFREKILIN